MPAGYPACPASSSLLRAGNDSTTSQTHAKKTDRHGDHSIVHHKPHLTSHATATHSDPPPLLPSNHSSRNQSPTRTKTKHPSQSATPPQPDTHSSHTRTYTHDTHILHITHITPTCHITHTAHIHLTHLTPSSHTSQTRRLHITYTYIAHTPHTSHTQHPPTHHGQFPAGDKPLDADAQWRTANSSARVDQNGSQSRLISESRCRAKLHGIFKHAQRQSKDGRFFLLLGKSDQLIGRPSCTAVFIRNCDPV